MQFVIMENRWNKWNKCNNIEIEKCREPARRLHRIGVSGRPGGTSATTGSQGIPWSRFGSLRRRRGRRPGGCACSSTWRRDGALPFRKRKQTLDPSPSIVPSGSYQPWKLMMILKMVIMRISIHIIVPLLCAGGTKYKFKLLLLYHLS